ncbi:WXG100-like domain-containing protein [Williamsia sp. SKLECPSW1]
MPTLVVDPAQYAHAADSMVTVAHSAQAAVSALTGELGASSGMGGSDNAGTEWASGYDQGARAALTAAASAVGATGNIATRLHATGENHAQADASSVIGGGGDAELAAAPTPPTMSAPSVPSAAGGSGGGPPGWSLVEGLVGYVWPNGHQDRLHAADAAWKAAAAQLQDAAGPTSAAASAVQAQQSPEAAAAAQACTDAGAHLRELSSVFTELGSSCSDYAAHLDQAHHEIIHELEVLLAQTVAIESLGAIAGFFTAGIGELAGQAIETARLTAAANRIREIIEALIAAARTVAAAVGRVAGEAGRIAAEASKAASAQVSKAAVQAAKSTGNLAGKAAESTKALGSKAGQAAPGFAKEAALAAPKNFATGAGMEAAKEGVVSIDTGHNHMDLTKIGTQGAIGTVTSPAAGRIADRIPLDRVASSAKAQDGLRAAIVKPVVGGALNTTQQEVHSAISPSTADAVKGTSLPETVKAVPGAVVNTPGAVAHLMHNLESPGVTNADMSDDYTQSPPPREDETPTR